MGLLCVVSDAEGLSENVLNQKTGWVVPKRRPTLLAQQLIEIINLNHVEKENISKAARLRVSDTFNLETQNDAFISFYAL